VLILGVAAGVAPARAQTTLVLEGTVRDAEGGAPLRTSVCLYARGERTAYGCGAVDSTGAYRLEFTSEPGLHQVWIQCAQLPRTLQAELLLEDSVRLDSAAPTRASWVVSTEGCDPRPLRRERIRVRGHYTSGFEASSLVPCERDAWFLPSDSLPLYAYDARDAWVEWPDDVGMDLLGYPAAPPLDDYGSAVAYADLIGVLEGPGSYGHLGVAVFRFTVERVVGFLDPREVGCDSAGV